MIKYKNRGLEGHWNRGFSVKCQQTPRAANVLIVEVNPRLPSGFLFELISWTSSVEADLGIIAEILC